MSPDTLYSDVMSRRYDEDFVAIFGGEDRGDLGFFCQLAEAARGPICEVGAGTGRVTLAVAAANRVVPVLGIEPSPAMRSRLEAKLSTVGSQVAGRVAARAGRFGELPLQTGSQALVYAAFRSFQHLLSPADQLAALTEMRRVCAPAGRVAVDLFDPDYSVLHDAEPTLVTRYETARDTVVERLDSRRIERVDQRVDVGFRWVERDADGRVVADDSASYAIRYTFPHELIHLFYRAGFAGVELFGDYDRSPLHAEPRELIAVARCH